MQQIFDLGENFSFIPNIVFFYISLTAFFIFFTLEVLILSYYYAKGGFQKESTRESIAFLISIFNLIYLILSMANKIVVLISISYAFYILCYLYPKSQFSNDNDGIVKSITYFTFIYVYIAFFYFIVDLDTATITLIMGRSVFLLFFILLSLYKFNQYLVNKKKAIKYRIKARNELLNQNYEKALYILGKAVKFANNIWVINRTENQLNLEAIKLDKDIKEGNFEDIENLIPEKLNQKKQITGWFIGCTIFLIFIISITILFGNF